MQVELWPAERLEPYARDLKAHEKALPKMMEALRQWGFRVPLLVTGAGAYLTGRTFCYTLKSPTREARLPPAAAPKARLCRYYHILQPTAFGRFWRYDVRVSARSRQLTCWGASYRLFYFVNPNT
ncbi:hypothetical protein [uncultured Desulfovibrio sp.]|uniref:hypothetical protein n=1 Tax=uncultured Desulfovibrio sp. TaxID=167968 RepID=UPI002614D859|nr:hypothetical protein [uncultured Desulfovibrio sp.]